LNQDKNLLNEIQIQILSKTKYQYIFPISSIVRWEVKDEGRKSADLRPSLNNYNPMNISKFKRTWFFYHRFRFFVTSKRNDLFLLSV